MSLSAALHGAVAVMRRRPDDLLPVYLLAAAVPAVVRVVVLAGVAVAYGYLELTGRLAPVVADLAASDLTPPDPTASPDAYGAWFDGLLPAVEPLFAPVVVGVLALALGLALLVGVSLATAVAAAQIAACDARLRDRRGLSAGLRGGRRHWPSFLAAYVIEAVVWLSVTVAAALVVGTAAATSPVAGVALGLLVVPGWVALVLGTRALFAFVPVAVVVDGEGVAAAVRASAGFLRREPVAAVGYYAVAVGALAALLAVSGLLAALEAPAAASLLGLLVVAPGLDLLKTGLFRGYRGSLSPPSPPGVGLREQASAGLSRGLRTVPRFVAEAPGPHAVALGLAVLGAAGGWVAVGPFVGAAEASIEARLVGHVPPVEALNFFANNWTVAASMALSGLAFGLPTVAALLTNGFLFGALARLEVAPATLVAFVLPHSVFEIPALVVSGALGLHLGRAAWAAWRGRLAPNGLADAIERAFWVLVGLAAVLAVAGFVEGFVSPYYWRPFL